MKHDLNVVVVLNLVPVVVVDVVLQHQITPSLHPVQIAYRQPGWYETDRGKSGLLTETIRDKLYSCLIPAAWE